VATGAVQPSVSSVEIAAMRRAIDLAARGADTVRPNPVVGCVVLDDRGDVVGEGWHERAGGPHAEIAALAAAGRRAEGGTAVVTLEPCNSTGRTGPCVDALLEAGIRRVVYAVPDPDASAAGGAQRLREQSVDVVGGTLADEAERVNERWLLAVRRKRPYVVWKYAATLDGRVAAADGTSRWISSAESRAQVHGLRAACDTIVAGVGTVLADDPHLTVRDADGALVGDQPLRVVVDTCGRTPQDARVRDEAAPTWVATAAELGRGRDGCVDLDALTHQLYLRGSRQVLLEGGPTLAGAFLRAGLVDRVVAYVAPLLLGGGRPVLADLGVQSLPDAVGLELLDVARVGPDVRIDAAPVLSTAPGRR
jgi:diaminohydroxyphosphoribosylaminopyrimidine deaminase/5-amino-6-(5-phosphoribosylamino)uracil reductase